MDRALTRADTKAAVYGEPGDRARLTGLVRALWPVLGGVWLAGVAAGLLVGLRVVASGAFFIAAAAVLIAASARSVRRVRSFFKGARGEERVAAVLANLPGGFAVFHGVDGGAGRRVSGAGDIDHVVVGPSGVWVIETKCWDGRVEVGASNVLFDGAPPSHDPVEQVRRLAARVVDDLARRLPDAPPVHALLCFAGSGFADGAARLGDVAVCGIARLYATVSADTAAPISDDDRIRLIEILKQAY
jgi:hypothetical protein